MTDLIRQSPVLKGVVSDYFSLEGHLLSTRSADLHRAIDRTRDEPVLVWVMRHPLKLQTEAIDSFLARLEAIQQIPAIGQNLLSFAVDSTGIGFAALKPLAGGPLTSGVAGGSASRAALAEAERRFIGCARLIDQLHQKQVSCGDLALGSFWVDRAGELIFVGIMGSHEGEAGATAMMPPPEIEQFAAPEQLGGAVDARSDVFALGVLGYHLFSGSMPFDGTISIALDQRTMIPLAQVVQGAPLWAEEVFESCLKPEPTERYANAAALLKGVSEARQKAFANADLPTRKESQAPAARQTSAVKPSGLSRGPAVNKPAAASSEPEPSPVGLLSRMRLLIAVVAVFIISAVVGAQLTSRTGVSPEGQSSEADGHSQAVGDNPEMKRVLDAVNDSQTKLAEAAARFDQLVASDDPLAHVILVKGAIEAKTPEIRGLAEKSLVQRVRRLGMLRSAEQLNQWVRTIPSGTIPVAYESLLKALNATLPLEARQSELRKAYVSDQRMTLRIAASIALDSQNVNDYQDLLAQLIGDALGLEDATKHSALGLILAHPELAVVFGDDVVQRRAELPDGDVLWLLGVLGTRNDFNVRAFASLAVERGILPPLRQEYLAVVRDRQDVPPEVLNALVKAAAGAISAEDIGAIGRWFDIEVEKILLLICADVKDETLLLEAFDTLAGKSLQVQPSATLVDWVRKNAWESRGQFARAIGVLGNIDKVPEEDAREAFRAFEPLLKDPRLVKVMVQTNDPFILRVIIDRYAGSLDLGTLLNMLGHKDKEVRILAVKSLKDFNDVGALKLIIDNYEREQDETVRQAYRDNFWMIRERAEKKQ